MTDTAAMAGGAMDNATRCAVLRRAPLFAKLADDLLAEIAARAIIRTVPGGTVLIRQGDPAAALYLVLSGRFRVSNAGASIATVGPGAPIGELAFFAGGTRTADVTAMRESTVMELDRAGYEAVVRAHPELSSEILAAVSARLVAVAAKAPPLPPQAGRVVMLAPASGCVLPKALVAGLRTAAAGRGDVRFHEAGDAPVARGPEALGEWLRGIETGGGRAVLVVRDPSAEAEWAGFAARSCDSRFIAGPLDAPRPILPGSPEAPAPGGGHGPGTQLLLWREASAMPIRGTAAWLSEREPALHHHLALDAPGDFARVLRFMCDAARGLVLSGGGAFGTAHLGAFRALCEAGIDIDFVGGTSVGAAMAAAIAMGLPADEIMRRCDEIFVTGKAMGRLTAPLYSVLNHHVFDAQLIRHYGAEPVEDLGINYFAVASSLSHNDLKVIRTGPLWKAVRASGSIPALLPPLIDAAGEVLVDGGMFDNLPLEVIRRLKAGPNIAMDFGPSRAWTVDADYDALPGPAVAAAGLVFGRRARRRRLHRFPRIASVLSRAMTMNSRRLIARTDFGNDVLLELPVAAGANFLDWRQGRAHFALAHDTLASALSRAAADHSAPQGADPLIERVRAAAALIREDPAS